MRRVCFDGLNWSQDKADDKKNVRGEISCECILVFFLPDQSSTMPDFDMPFFFNHAVLA